MFWVSTRISYTYKLIHGHSGFFLSLFFLSLLLFTKNTDTENTSLREIFLKYDLDGSSTIDRTEMTMLMQALQFPTPINEKEFHDIAGDDAEIDYLELHE